VKAPPYRFTWFDWVCLWYPPGWLVLFNRHWQHYHDDPEGWNWLEYGLFLLPGGFYLALLSRWLRLGCRLPHKQNRPFEPTYQQAFRDEILDPIVRYYFRGELRQLENLPQSGPLIVAMNHAGMCFPWDFLGLACLLSQARGWIVQPLASLALFDHPWVRWWLPAGWSQVLGGVRAERNNFEAALVQNTILLYQPEGLRGPAKGWKQRYQLQTFHPSLTLLSDRYRIPILPVVCIGSEFLHPWAVNVKKLARRLTLPFFPLSLLMPLLLLFPSTGVWAMRSRLYYYLQPLHQPWSLAPAPDPLHPVIGLETTRFVAYQQAEKLRKQLQGEIEQLLNQTSPKKPAR